MKMVCAYALAYLTCFLGLCFIGSVFMRCSLRTVAGCILITEQQAIGPSSCCCDTLTLARKCSLTIDLRLVPKALYPLSICQEASTNQNVTTDFPREKPEEWAITFGPQAEAYSNKATDSWSGSEQYKSSERIGNEAHLLLTRDTRFNPSIHPMTQVTFIWTD